MIIYLFKQPNRFTLDKFFLTHWAPRLKKRLRMVSYGRFMQWRNAPAATYIFSDIERLSVEEQERVASIKNQIRAAFPGARFLNDPLLSKKRYPLLRHLRDTGVNSFDVYRPSELRTPSRFPVFIRDENGHLGPLSGLLETPEALTKELDHLREKGVSLDDKVIVEYLSVANDDGLFHKYGDYCVGGRIISQHVLFSQEWLVKFSDDEAAQARQVEEERVMTESHPYKEQVSEIFKAANIDYGRIDYAVLDGKVQVFEINTNPQVFPTVGNTGPRQENRARFLAEMEQAFLDLDDQGTAATTVIHGAKGRLKSAVSDVARDRLYDVMRITGNLHHENRIRDGVRSLFKRG